ncbi:tetratricopeptide repeat protein [Acidithiobacillus sp. M4-SHS-6]|uniref:tetratricopeptide repeat protein n=1 Tax=Acidithiobacillus sp. M4-SHS-6 TaxID=3383024 RepID=UPI0039BDBFD9
MRVMILKTTPLIALLGSIGLLGCPAAWAMTSTEAHSLCLQAQAGDSTALTNLTEAAQHGNRSAENWLGVYYGLKRQYQAAVPWTRKAALQGDPLAEFVMGNIYYYGNGVPKNVSKSVYWYRLAVDQGFQKAEPMLQKAQAKLRMTSLTTPATPIPGKPLTPAVAGHPNSQRPRNPGQKTVTATATPKSMATPRAQALSPAAENHLGYAYYSGQGKTQNYQKAFYWFRKAARQGNASAENNLGVAYNHGQGVAQNNAKALYWYRKAAQQGNPSGETNLGVAYYEGSGVKSNTPQALHWWKMAAAQGDHRAQSYLDVVQSASPPAS